MHACRAVCVQTQIRINLSSENCHNVSILIKWFSLWWIPLRYPVWNHELFKNEIRTFDDWYFSGWLVQCAHLWTHVIKINAINFKNRSNKIPCIRNRGQSVKMWQTPDDAWIRLPSMFRWFLLKIFHDDITACYDYSYGCKRRLDSIS